MTAVRRTTWECSVNQLTPKLIRAFQDYFQAHTLGDLVLEALLCCETLTERIDRSRLAAWLDGYPDTTEYLGLILTEQWLLWARAGDRSKTIVIGANLKEIRARAYTSRFSKESGLELGGLVGDRKERVHGKLALGPEEAARKFVDEVIQSVEKANPPPKQKEIPWLKWWPKRENRRDR